MVLSKDITETASTWRKDAKSMKRSNRGSIGGMNVTEAKIDVRRAPKPKGKRDFKGSEAVLGKGNANKPNQPFKALKMQRALSPVSYGRRTQVKESIAGDVSFDNFALLPVIKNSIGPEVLHGRTDLTPSPIQRLAIPALLGSVKEYRPTDGTMQQFLLAAETGSGKTLAYLLPVVDALKRAEMSEKQFASKDQSNAKLRERDALFELDPPSSKEIDPSSGRPKIVILVPTAELVDQVGAVAKSLSHAVKFRTALLSANYSGQVIRNRLFSPGGVDLVVTTPHLLSSIIESDPNVVAQVSHLVIDEADSLLDRSFSPTTRAILNRATPSLKQLILCSATIPRNFDSFLHKHFPDLHRLTTPNLHAIPRRVQLSVVDIEGDPYKSNRRLACADTISNIARETSSGNSTEPRTLPILVFVNEREAADDLASFLQSKGIAAMPLTRDASARHSTALDAFTGTPGAQQQEQPKDSRFPGVTVLVTTDLGSRGIDTLPVQHVVLYDVPHTSIDFIHRLGRVGRMGRRGRGYVLVGKGDRRDVVREVRTGMFMGKALI